MKGINTNWPTVPWGIEEAERLASLWADGLSYGEIGKLMKRTRNSIAGAVRRFHLPKRGRYQDPRQPPRAPAAMKRTA